MKDVLIIGAGAAGLMAARELTKQGRQVIILEARNRAGGRIHTEHDKRFPFPLELGAEFVHGNLPLTLQLLNEAGIQYEALQGEAWRSSNGKFSHNAFFIEGWNVLEEKLQALEHDMSIATFLEKNFPGEKFSSLRKSVTGFAEGYDAADSSRASTFALRDEWLGDDDPHQYRVHGGYASMVDFLVKEISANGGEVHLSAVVKEIRWQRGGVSVITEGGESFEARKVIVTVPPGVLQVEPSARGAIIFSPAIHEKISAVHQLGYGAVIKVLLVFKTAFWREEGFEKVVGVNLEHLGFLFSEVSIPTWWTQFPSPAPMLTGWLAGPKAAQLKAESEEFIFQKALDSLSVIFQMSDVALKEKLSASFIVNWTADPFTRGAYAYATVDSTEAIKILKSPIEETVYFAGEALYEGHAMGTVEAALVSGKEVAEKILSE